MSTIASAVELAVRAEPRLRHLQSVIVVHAEDVVAERYFRDRRAEDLSNVHSVTKSVLSTLVGIAIDDGSLKLSTTIGDDSASACRSMLRKPSSPLRIF